MNVVVLEKVEEFLEKLEPNVRSNVHALVLLLQEYGHKLSMPDAKPIGGGLWELRSNTRPAIRILYGFCRGEAVLVLGFKKQRPALLSREIELARKRLTAYCA